MSKRKRTSEIEKWIKQGRGSGISIDYKQWLKQNIYPKLLLQIEESLRGILSKI